MDTHTSHLTLQAEQAILTMVRFGCVNMKRLELCTLGAHHLQKDGKHG